MPPPDAVTAFEALAAVSMRPARIMRPPPPVEEDGLPTHPGWAIDALLEAGAELAGAAGAAPAVVVLADLGLEEYRLGLALAGNSPRRAAAHQQFCPRLHVATGAGFGAGAGWVADGLASSFGYGASAAIDSLPPAVISKVISPLWPGC